MKTAGFIVVRGQDLALSVPLKLEKFKGHRHPMLVYGDQATLFHSRAAARWAIRRHVEMQGELFEDIKRERAAKLHIKRVLAEPSRRVCPPRKRSHARQRRRRVA